MNGWHVFACTVSQIISLKVASCLHAIKQEGLSYQNNEVSS